MLRAKMLFQYITFHHIKAHNFMIKLKLKFLHKNCDIHITLPESPASGRVTAFTNTQANPRLYFSFGAIFFHFKSGSS